VTNRERADQLFSEASGIIEDMWRALQRARWNLATRRAQEVIELIVKGLLNEMGVEYPRTHDAAPMLAETVRQRHLEADHAFLDWLIVMSARLAQLRGPAFYHPTTVGGGCFLGVSVVAAADTAALETGYGACAQEAHALAPTYQPRSVCTDGWHATREAWRRLFPTITLVRCFLHAVLKSMDRCRGALRHEGVAKAWGV